MLGCETVQQPEAAHDPCSHDGDGDRQDTEQLHHRESGCRTRAESRWAQSQSGTTNNEVKKRHRWNGDHNDEYCDKRTKQNPHECHSNKGTSRSVNAEVLQLMLTFSSALGRRFWT